MYASDIHGKVRIDLTVVQAAVVLEPWLGPGVRCLGLAPLEGGYCSAVYRLQFDRPPYVAVIKLHDSLDDDPLPRECEQLGFLHRQTSVPCPQVYLQDNSRLVVPYSYLLLECLPGVNLEAAGLAPEQRTMVERELAAALLELHAHTRETFGDIRQEPGVRDWREILLPELEENRRDVDGMLPADVLAELDRALLPAAEALRDQGAPTLIHHDMWGGNIMVCERGDGWHLSGLLDPVGLQYADVEMELAYLQAFNTVGQTFFDAYTARQPLRPGYEFRRLFYWLNTYMLHVWLGFGPAYVDLVAKTSRQIIAGE